MPARPSGSNTSLLLAGIRRLRVSGDRSGGAPTFVERKTMKTPEIQWHNDLTDAAAIELLDPEFPGAHEFTAIGVMTVKDPEPSRGYTLLVVVDGLTRSMHLGDTIEESKEALTDWDTIENLLGIDA
jgi:hypothetical protein